MYIYLGKYFHRHGKDMSGLNEIKIGKTINLDQREHQLNNTKMTIGYAYVKAFQAGEDTDKVEKQLHAILDHNRLDGEWFEDDENSTLIYRVSKFMSIGGYPEVELGLDKDEDVNKVRKVERMKEDNREFFEKKVAEHPELFAKACVTWAHTLGWFNKYYLSCAKRGNNFYVELIYKNKDPQNSIINEDFIPFVKEVFGEKFVDNKFKVYAKTDNWEDALDMYKKILVAGKEGTINLNKEEI